MPRPPGLDKDAVVDAAVQAHARGTVERHFQASQLPRLAEAGIVEPAEIRIAVRFSIVEGRVALSGDLHGLVTMTCQRCMKLVAVDVSDEFQLVIVDDEVERRQLEEATGGYEPIVADAARFDMQWLAEEQTLLSVPLVPKHDDERCAPSDAVAPTMQEAKEENGVSQHPFASLKELLRDK